MGVKAAANKVIENTQMRQGLRIVDPLKKPIKLKVRRKTGSSKAKPKSKIILKTKSRYSSNLTRFSRLLGVKPNKLSTACGKIK